MPVDVAIADRSGRQVNIHIPLSLMLGSRPEGGDVEPFNTLPAWQWTDPYYTFAIPGKLADLASVSLDPLQRQAEVDRSNDRIDLPVGAGGFTRP